MNKVKGCLWEIQDIAKKPGLSMWFVIHQLSNLEKMTLSLNQSVLKDDGGMISTLPALWSSRRWWGLNSSSENTSDLFWYPLLGWPSHATLPPDTVPVSKGDQKILLWFPFNFKSILGVNLLKSRLWAPDNWERLETWNPSQDSADRARGRTASLEAY